jgi:ParB/RepB/Spo0J family partition protein
MAENKKISEIKVKDNIRTDMGDLKELSESIKEHGILEPLIIEGENILIAGYRRLAAAKLAGLKEVPVIRCESGASREELQIIENIHRKNLTPFEEAQAFSDYMKSRKKDEIFLANSINKTVDYIKRRLLLLKLSQESTHALNERKIEIGHAQLLAQMDEKQQVEALKSILEWDLTVQNFSDQIRWMTKIDFGDIEFRSNIVKDKKQKTLMDSLGVELSPKNYVDGNLKDNPAFKKDILKYVETERKKLTDKGITVFASEDELKAKYPKATQVYDYKENFNKIIKSLPGSKEYAVVVDLGGYYLDKDIYELNPKEEKIKFSPSGNEEVTD